MARKTIEDLVTERYGDEEVRQAVLDDIASRGTSERIVSGELVLPSEPDAHIWFARTKQQQQEEDKRSALERRLDDMEARMQARHDEGNP